MILSWRSVINVDAKELSFFPVSPAMFLREERSCCAWQSKWIYVIQCQGNHETQAQLHS